MLNKLLLNVKNEGFAVSHDKDNNCYYIYTDSSLSEFVVLAEDMFKEDGHLNLDMLTFWTKDNIARKVNTKFKKLPHQLGGYYPSENVAQQSIPFKEPLQGYTIYGGLEYLFEDINSARLAALIVPESEVFKTVLSIYENYLSKGVFVEEYELISGIEQRDIKGSENSLYIRNGSLLFESRIYGNWILKYTLSPWYIYENMKKYSKIEFSNLNRNPKVETEAPPEKLIKLAERLLSE